MNKKIKLLFVGDFCSITPEKLIIGKKLKYLIADCDLKVINFEGPLQIGTLCSPNNKFLKQSEGSPKWCIDSGFNVIGLANNHSYDFGEEGLKATANAFRNQIVVGCGQWEEAYSTKYVTIADKRIGFLAATSADMSALKDYYEDSTRYGCAWINHYSMIKRVIEAKAKCDYLFMLPHAGVEFMNVPLPEWREIYKSFIDFGCDAIIASHPHVPQGWEIYKGKPIFYSLGNFVFEKESDKNLHHNWNNGLCVILEILDENISFKVQSTLYNNHNVDIDDTLEREKDIQGLFKILDNDEIYIREVNKGVLEYSIKYKNWLLDGFNAVEYKKCNLKGLYHNLMKIFRNKFGEKIALHQIREESTRWTICRALKIRTKTDL